jgi:hypothetical protein
MCMFCRSLFVLFLAIVLSVLRYTDSDYPFGIFKLFLELCLRLNDSIFPPNPFGSVMSVKTVMLTYSIRITQQVHISRVLTIQFDAYTARASVLII